MAPSSLLLVSLCLTFQLSAATAAVPLQRQQANSAEREHSDHAAERRARFLEMMNQDRQRHARHRSDLVPYVKRTFGPVIVGLPLSSADQVKLLELLTKRTLAVADRRHDFSQRENAAKIADPLAFNPRPNGFSPQELEREVARAVAEVENEIEKLVGPSLFPRIKVMIECDHQLSVISSGYAEALEEAGHPLKAEDRLHLASVLHWLQSAENYLRLNKTIPLNPSGLTPVDEEALEKMREHLSSGQVDQMKLGFIFTNRAVRGIPIEYERECDLPADVEQIIAKANGQDGQVYGRISVTLRGAAKAKLNPRWNNDDLEYCAVEFTAIPYSKDGMGYLMTFGGIALFYHGQFVKLTGENQVVWIGRRPRPKL